MKKTLLVQALRLARDKLPQHPELGRFAHYSFIVQDSKIVEWATNTNFEPPRHYGYHRKENGFCPKFHAEIFAYKRARGLLADSSFEIINIRLNKTGEVRLSKPCQPCSLLMAALGCTKFLYSAEVGFLEYTPI